MVTFPHFFLRETDVYFELNNSNISRYSFLLLYCRFNVKILGEIDLQMNSTCIQKSEYIKYLYNILFNTSIYIRIQYM